MSSVIVSIDGPAGTGKSTVSREVARHLELPHLDTGAYYRATTLMASRAGIRPTDGPGIANALRNVTLDQNDGAMFLDGENVSTEIRGAAVGSSVSEVSTHPEVRRILVDAQRAWVAGRGGSAVVEGRDIGSVVFPGAQIKIYLDANPEVRAARRSSETGQLVESVLGEQNLRDQIDSTREESPLVVPPGSIVIDTSRLEIEEVVQTILDVVAAGSR